MAGPNTVFLAGLDQELQNTPYRVVAPLGHGGMGAIFEVEHRTLRRKLVMKILREPGRPDLEDRLRMEAQALAQLSHPNLLAVVDFAKTDVGRPFLVTERLYGRTLRQVVGISDALPIREAVLYASQALAGLAVAHRAGVIHRDVKLDNLFLCDGDGLSPPSIKVIDFGIVKLVGAEPGEQGVDVQPLENPTAEGQMVGTPRFMSPEQVLNKSVDQRADLYGIGVVLYRLVSGRYPFICGSVIEYAAAHATEIPKPPSRFAPNVPPELDKVILRVLEKRAEDRYFNAREMIDALSPFLCETPAIDPEPPRKTPNEPNAIGRGTIVMRESPQQGIASAAETILLRERQEPRALATEALPRMAMPSAQVTPRGQAQPPSPAPRAFVLAPPELQPVPQSPPAAQWPPKLVGATAQSAREPGTPKPFGAVPPAFAARAKGPAPATPAYRDKPVRNRAVEIIAGLVAVFSLAAIIWFLLLLIRVIR